MSDDETEGRAVAQIDELHLDKECIRLPTDFIKYAVSAANAKAEVVRLKAELELVEADLSKQVRDHPAKYGLEKDTKDAVAGAVILHPKFQEAQRVYHKAQYRSDLAMAIVQTLEHKKRALTLRVELFGLGYFSDPKISRRGKEAVEEMTKRRVRRAWEDD